jgi:hypothetical protein
MERRPLWVVEHEVVLARKLDDRVEVVAVGGPPDAEEYEAIGALDRVRPGRRGGSELFLREVLRVREARASSSS